MSGYFMLRRNDFLQLRNDVNARGFKILLEIAAHMKPRALSEVPYTFGPRMFGQSKLSTKIAFAFAQQLWSLSLHNSVWHGGNLSPRKHTLHGVPVALRKSPSKRSEPSRSPIRWIFEALLRTEVTNLSSRRKHRRAD